MFSVFMTMYIASLLSLLAVVHEDKKEFVTSEVSLLGSI